MSDRVLDASALTLALGDKSDAASALRARLVGVRRHAPHLIDAEVGNVLRRHERAGRLSGDEAAQALRAAAVLIDHVALAVSLDLPLVTADVRLSAAPGMPCTIELV